MSLFDQLDQELDVPLELSALFVAVMKDGLKQYGPRAWSSMVAKRLEDDCGTDVRSPDFTEYLVDHEPEGKGVEIIVKGRTS